MKRAIFTLGILIPQLVFSAPSVEDLAKIVAAQQASISSLRGDVKRYVQILGDRLAYYNLDGKDGLENRSGVGPTVNRFQQMGQASAFREGSCLLDNRGVEHNKRLNSGGSLSIVGWIKPQKFSSGMIAAKHYTNSKRSWNVNMADGKLQFEIIGSDSNFVILDTALPKDGKWHHFATVYDKGLGRMTTYIDGRESNSSTVGPITLMETNLPITIGCYLLNDDATAIRDHFVGDIDEISIFNRPLSSDQVTLLMNFDS
jgi:hypothetical protein